MARKKVKFTCSDCGSELIDCPEATYCPLCPLPEPDDTRDFTYAELTNGLDIGLARVVALNLQPYIDLCAKDGLTITITGLTPKTWLSADYTLPSCVKGEWDEGRTWISFKAV